MYSTCRVLLDLIFQEIILFVMKHILGTVWTEFISKMNTRGQTCMPFFDPTNQQAVASGQDVDKTRFL